jgi:hypothetical protein
MNTDMKKQTAVEWLTEMITDMIHEAHHSEFADLFESAKAMEKEQIIAAYRNGRKDEDTAYYDAFFQRTCEDYYNETYGGDK